MYHVHYTDVFTVLQSTVHATCVVVTSINMYMHHQLVKYVACNKIIMIMQLGSCLKAVEGQACPTPSLTALINSITQMRLSPGQPLNAVVFLLKVCASLL